MREEWLLKPQGEVLAAYAASRARCAFIRGPLGSGKTIQTIQTIVQMMCEQAPNAHGVRPTRFYAIRNTYTDLLSTTKKDWMDLCGNLGRYVEGSRQPPTQYLHFRLENGTIVESEMIFLALDREEHVRKLRGAQATGFWLSEVKELPQSVCLMADLRHGRYPSRVLGGVDPTWHGMRGDYNSPDDEHWLYQFAEGQLPPDIELDAADWEFYHQPGGVYWEKETQSWRVNPQAENIHNLPNDYYAKGIQGKGWDWVNVNLANNYGTVIEGKPVFERDYVDQVHCSQYELLPIKGLGLMLGWDFGLWPACIVAQMAPNGQLRILDEIIGENIGVTQFVKDVVAPTLKTKYRGHRVILSVGDPSGSNRNDNDEERTIDAITKAGIPTEEAKSNLITPRLDAVRYWLTHMISGRPGFLLSPACKTLRKGFISGYQWRKLRVAGEARYSETPDKNRYSHPHDGLQYICMEMLPEERMTKMPKALPAAVIDDVMGM